MDHGRRKDGNDNPFQGLLRVFLKEDKPLRLNGIEIAGAESDLIDLNELKKKFCLRVKKYQDAIYFGQVDPKQMI